METVTRRTSHGTPVTELRIELQPNGPAVSSLEPVTVGSAATNVLVVEDPAVSRFHLELVGTADGVRVVDCGSTNGSRANEVFFRDATVHVRPGTTIEIGRSRLLVNTHATTEAAAEPVSALGALVGSSPPMQRLYRAIRRVAPTNASVHIRGESGSGKELVARAIHDNSTRANGPFVVFDCGAIAPTLLASELFGHEKGAFTGADRRHEGVFARANHGTLFFDEIGELPPEQQVALLGALERRQVRRVGGSEDIPIDVRVLSATHRDLRGDINRGTFRLDLYYRLAVVSVEVPPLRARMDDIHELVEHIARQLQLEERVTPLLDAEGLERLTAYPWPGNVRELRNVVEATATLGRLRLGDPRLTSTAHSYGESSPVRGEQPQYRAARRAVLDEFERRYLAEVLRQADGRVRRAARIARMDRTYLAELLKRHGLAADGSEDE